jgi:hypothetical protein
VSGAWSNTSDTLDIEYEWLLDGVPQGVNALAPASTNVTGGPFAIGSRVVLRVRYTQGVGFEGAWATSHPVRITDLV